ncbi:MAG: c-type cytochrome [Actinomycetota bacterium]
MSERGAARAWIIAYVVMAGVGLATLILVGRLVGANKLPGETQARQTATDGKTLFEANCAVCHGVDARGQRNAPSLVSGPLAALSIDELVAKISNGRRLAGMPKFEGVLTPAQIRAVAEYILSLREAS